MDAIEDVRDGLVVAVELQRKLGLRAGHAIEALEEVMCVGHAQTLAPQRTTISLDQRWVDDPLVAPWVEDTPHAPATTPTATHAS